MSTTYAPPAHAVRVARTPRSAPAARPQIDRDRRTGSGATSGAMRLTRRGRAVVLVLGVALMLALGVLWGATSAATDEPGVPATETVRVGAGDTLWVIASERVGEGESVQGVIDEIRSLNELPSAALQAGQTLVVPVAG